MKKFNRREKTILRLMLLVIGLWVFMEIQEAYVQSKIDLEADIEATSAQITSQLTQLQGQSPQKYLDDAAALDDQLKRARQKIMGLPNRGVASEIISSTLNKKALNAGVELTSISGRRPEEVGEESELLELRTYFAFNSDLRELLSMMESLEDEPYYLVLHQVNVTSRRNNLRRNRRKGSNARKKGLNGNALISTLFKQDANGKESDYRQAVVISPDGESAGADGKPDAGEKADPEKSDAGQGGGVKADQGQPKKQDLPRLDVEARRDDEDDFEDGGRDADDKRAPQPRPETRRPPVDQSSADRAENPKLKPPARPLTESSKPKSNMRRKFRP